MPVAPPSFQDWLGAQVHREDLVGSLARLPMEAFTYAPSAVQIEQNAHEENQVLGTAFQSVGHMLANVWWDRDGNAANVWAVDAGGRFGVKI